MTSIPLSTTTTQDRVLRRLAQEFDSPDTSIATLVELLDSGWGIPYLSRYKSRETGGIAEQRMYELRQRVAEVRMLEEHKTVILETAERAGWLDDDVTSAVLAFTGLDRLEDYWQTLKRRKNGPAAMARANGLGPLADALRAPTMATARRSRRWACPMRPRTGGASSMLASAAGYSASPQIR